MADYKFNKSLIVDLHCFGSIDYYFTLIEYNKLRFELYEHFKKGSYYNRYRLAGPNGKILLTVPLLHTHRERMAFRDLKICNRDRWQVLHWRTLTSAYRRSPWFEFYEESLHTMYERKYEYLLDWNQDAYAKVAEWLGLSQEISYTGSYQKKYLDEDLLDARDLVLPGNEATHDRAFRTEYRQVFADRTGFVPGLSILDLIFCEGKRTLPILKSGDGEAGVGRV